MNTSKVITPKVNGGDGEPQDQQHAGRKPSDTEAARDERFNRQDASETRRMSRETAERIPADPDPDDPASP